MTLKSPGPSARDVGHQRVPNCQALFNRGEGGPVVVGQPVSSCRSPLRYGTKRTKFASAAAIVALAWKRCQRTPARTINAAGVAVSGAEPPAHSASACVVVSGLPGCGKSTLCRLLCGAFENSAWLNQDNYVITGKPRTTFLTSVKAGLRNALRHGSALVCVDKVNLQKAHRDDILKQAEAVGWMEKDGIMLLVELTTDNLVEHCMSRIESRGAAHKSLQPSEKLQAILERHEHDREPLDEEELQTFQQVHIDSRREAVEKALQVVRLLRTLGWSPRLRPLKITAAASEEWVKFPTIHDRPTYYWNRRTGESVWQKPENVEPAFHGFPHQDKAYFRCVRTQETMWELPPLQATDPFPMPSDLDAEEQLRFLLEAEWTRLQCQEEAWKRSAGTAKGQTTESRRRAK